MKEEWRDIKNYEGYYQVSSLGEVRSLNRLIKTGTGYRTKRGQKINGVISNRGYVNQRLWKDGKMKNILEHRLVANAFIPNPNNLPEINHKDGNKLNNTVKNLEWVSRSQNIIHAFETGLEKPKKSIITKTTFDNIVSEISEGCKVKDILKKYNCSARIYYYRKKYGFRY